MERRKRRRTIIEGHADTCCIYARVSSAEQAASGTSLDAQTATLHAYAAMKHLTVVEVIVDGGVSGSTPLGERPGGKRLLTLVESGQVAAVLATKLDRMFRSVRDCLTSVDTFEQCHVATHFVDQNIETASAMGRFFRTVMAAVAEMERETICDRVRAGLRQKKVMGELCGGIPVGFRRTAAPVRFKTNPDGSQRPLYGIEPDPREQEALVLMQRGVEQGLSLRKIGATLIAAGYHPRKGKDWAPSTLMRTLDALERRQTDAA